MSKFVAGHVTKMWYLKLWITSFWREILHLNFKEIVEKMMYQTFNKIQAKSNFGRHVGGQEYALQQRNQSAIKYPP